MEGHTPESPLSAGPILSSRNPPDSSGSTLTCRGQLTGAWVSPRSQSSEQAHWSQPGCGPRRLAGQLLPSTDKTTDSCYTWSKQPLPHPIKELIIDFLALLSNCLMIAFLRAVNRAKMAPNSIPQLGYSILTQGDITQVTRYFHNLYSCKAPILASNKAGQVG